MKRILVITIVISLFISCTSRKNNEKLQAQVQTYLDSYNAEFQKLYYAAGEGQWLLNTRIVKGDTITKKMASAADEVFAAFTGSQANIDSAKKYLAIKDHLTALQVMQLEYVLFNAGNNPASAAEIVKQRIAATNKQTEKLYGFTFMHHDTAISVNGMNDILTNSIDLEERLKIWEASKEIGKTLKGGLDTLQDLRNQCVQALGFSDFFSYMVSEYGMNTDEMRQLTHSMIADVWPLYRELHTWARYDLAAKYNQPVPDYIPAHWLPNRWGQDWTAMVKVEGLDIDSILKTHDAEWIMKKGEEFWMSLGFDSLPKTFWEKSSLYPVPPNSPFSKNTHASAWHMDLGNDLRSLMSVKTNTDWWSTVLHELGHIYYYQSYSVPEVPIVLRTGANRGYHEAFGTMIGLASLQKPFLESLQLIPAGAKSNDTIKLLNEALDYIVHIPWGSGVMTEFEYELYAKNLPKNQYNSKWWELVKKYQGIVPPTERGEEYCDAATKTHINDDPAGYYDYSISNVLLFQFHTYIAGNILKQDPHATNYWGNKGVGDFLKKVMALGATVEWREHLRNSIGNDMSAKDMVDYFAPLMTYLKKVNEGRTYTLPEKPVFD